MPKAPLRWVVSTQPKWRQLEHGPDAAWLRGAQLVVEASGDGADDALRALAIVIDPSPVEQRMEMLGGGVAHISFTWRQVDLVDQRLLGDPE